MHTVLHTPLKLKALHYHTPHRVPKNYSEICKTFLCVWNCINLCKTECVINMAQISSYFMPAENPTLTQNSPSLAP